MRKMNRGEKNSALIAGRGSLASPPGRTTVRGTGGAPNGWQPGCELRDPERSSESTRGWWTIRPILWLSKRLRTRHGSREFLR